MTRARRVGVVRGTVQGVGFRPFLARLAAREGVAGEARNAGGVVHVDVEGAEEAVRRFQESLRGEAPAAARVETVSWRSEPPRGRVSFEIATSEHAAPDALPLPPDLAPCADCLTELRDPAARRSGYAFTSCASCGPRASVVTGLPYDRARTTMASFPLCGACRAEYDALTDRRHHAQPLACPTCGPRLSLTDRLGRQVAERPLEAARAALRRGEVLAVMGVGGFQLVCDATDERAVRRLRDRKRRPHKALAVMTADLAAARRLAHVSSAEAEALSSPGAPIVLCRARPGQLAPSVAPGLSRLGVMLPSSPLHHLLLDGLGPLVCTSGNLHEEPIAIDPDEARARLGEVAAAFLVHDRPIARRLDDAVVHVVAGAARTLRLGRGLGPLSIPLRSAAPRLCTGGHLKCAPAMALPDRAVCWPHVGDLDGLAARAAWEEAVASMQALLGVAPAELVTDRHPDYATSRWAETRGLPIRRVPHHAAHVAACLAESQASDALGFAWDGFGLGEGGALWGGETFVAAGGRLTRVGGLRPFPIAGGDAAARDGGRALAGLLVGAGRREGWPEVAARYRPLSSPRLSRPTTSVGRLFDAVAALTGVCTRSTYEGEAAMRLEALASPGAAPYPIEVTRDEIDWRPILAALDPSDDPARVASRFHATLVDAVVRTASLHRAPVVALSGGVFQNARLVEDACAALRDRGVDVLLPTRIPPHDGGLSLGQAWLAARGDG